jgi:hypothetical protein
MYTGKNEIRGGNVEEYWTPTLMAFLALINIKYWIKNKDREKHTTKQPTGVMFFLSQVTFI